MRRVFLFLFFLVLGTFAFSADFACAAGPTYISSDINGSTEITWTEENSPYIISSFLNVNAPLTIEAGTVVKFGRNGGLAIRNEFHVNGTSTKKVVFTSSRDDSVGGDTDRDGGAVKSEVGSWSYLMIATPKGKEMKIRYAELRYSTLGFYVFSSAENMSIKYCDIRENGFGIWAYNPNLTIEKNIITDNLNVGIKIEAGSRTATAVNNAIYGNTVGAMGASTGVPNPKALKAENNWWGDESGPQNEANLGGKGNSVSGLVSFNPWLAADPIASPDPVIIIPGIMGSWKVDGKWQIDPLLHSYENLKKAMESAGYIEGENMFDFPYQWRNSNVKNSELLRDAVNVVKEKTGRPKVDIVAHSMGGLIAREYIESDYYQNDVDQLITLGTPQAGSPKAYLIWEAGEADSYLEDKILKMIFNREAKKAGYENIFYYAREKIPSLQELLPTYDYIFDLDLNIPRIYPEKYPRNIFLENINSSGKTSRLQKVEFDNIYGKTNKKSTIGGYNVIDAPAFGDYWKHGYPKDFNIPWSSDGLVYVAGDGTVPENSATYLKGDRNIEINASHNQIPTEAQQDVIELLTGKRPASKVTSEGPEIKEILLVQVYCPVDITVIDPHGKVVGKNQNDIEGAVYINNGDDEEFLTIPNPEDGEYKILTEGTGTGEYTIETTKITENEKTGETIETTETITGTAELDKQEENKIKIDGDSVKKVQPLTLSPKKKEPDAGGEEKINTEIPQVAQEIFQDQIVVVDLLNDQLAENPTKIEQLDALKNSVREYFKTKQIRKKREKNYLLGWLGNIRVYLKRSQVFEEKFMVSQKKYKNLQKKIVGHCNHLIKYLNKNSPKKIDESAKNDLVERLNILKL